MAINIRYTYGRFSFLPKVKMPTGYDLSDIRYENIVLRDRNSELEEENDKLCEELVENTIPRYEQVAGVIFIMVLSIVFGIALQATYGILPNV